MEATGKNLNDLKLQKANEEKVAQQILDEAKVDVDNKISGLVWEDNREKSILNTQHSCDLLRETKSGQESLDAQDELWRNEMNVRHISRTQYEQQKQLNFYTEYQNMYTTTAQKSVSDAIKQNKTAEQFYEDVKSVQPKLRLTDADGMEIVTDMTKIDEQVKKDIYSMFNAAQRDAWQKTETEFAQLWDRVQDQRTAEGKNIVKKEGRTRLDQLKDTGLISPEQLVKWTNWLALEDYMDGNGTRSQANAAANKLNPKDLLQWTLNATKRGDESALGGPATYYDAWDFYKNRVMEEYTSIPGKENATWEQLEREYPVVGEFFDYAEKNLPDEFKDIVSFAENTIKAILNTKDNKDAYKEEYASTMNCVKDILYETNVADLDKTSMESLKKRVTLLINANLGGVLEKQKQYKEYFEDYKGQKTLSDYREGVWGKEKRMAQAMQERDANPDLVYTNQYGVKKGNFGNDVQQGLTRLEADERAELVKIIKSRTGKDIPAGAISAAWENDGTHDIKARKIYTIDGVDYRFKSDDGKHIILEEKKNGYEKVSNPNADDVSKYYVKDKNGAYKKATNYEEGTTYYKEPQWTTSKTDAQQKKYDSVEEQAKRAVKSKSTDTIPEGGFTYTDDDGKVQQFTYTDPEGEEKVITQAYWKRLLANEKQRIIQEFMEKNPEAAQRWINAN